MQGNTQVKDPEKKIIFEKENCGLEEKAHVSTSFFFFFFSIDNREFQPYFLSTLFLPLRTEQIGFSSRKGLYLFFELAVSLLPSLNTTGCWVHSKSWCSWSYILLLYLFCSKGKCFPLGRKRPIYFSLMMENRIKGKLFISSHISQLTSPPFHSSSLFQCSGI